MSEHSKTQLLISAKELAQTLGLSKRQIHRLNSCGKLPAPVRIGGSIRWVQDEISAWIDAGCPDRQTRETRKEAENAA